jgi:urea transport system permease protein
MFLSKLILTAFLTFAASAHAISVDDANAISSGETDARIEALNNAVARADAGTAVFLQALADDAVKLVRGKAIMVRDDKGIDPATGAEFALPEDAEDVINNNRMRGEIDSALAALKLFSKDDKVRMAAVQQMQRDADPSKLALIEQALSAEQNPKVSDQLALVRAAALLGGDDKAQRHQQQDASQADAAEHRAQLVAPGQP